jgi:hypothetical protein
MLQSKINEIKIICFKISASVLILISLCKPGLINAQTWQPMGAGVSDWVQSMSADSLTGNVYAGGSFANSGSQIVNYIARWNNNAWNPMSTGIGGLVFKTYMNNGQLYVGGGFGTAGTVAANNIAKWNGSAWQALGTGTNHNVRGIVELNGSIYAGGWFSQAGSQTCNHVARWNGSAWSALGQGTNYDVYALEVYGGQLIAGGCFTTAGSISVGYIARWNGTSWQSLGSGLNGYVYYMTVHNGQLVVAGSFTIAGGVTANRIAKWNGSTWSTYGSGFNDFAWTLQVFKNELYAGGYFTASGATPLNYISKWNGTAWTNVAGGFNSRVTALTYLADTLYAGGYFTQSNGVNMTRTAKIFFPASLPVELISFTGKQKENSVELEWSTVTETNNDYFTVEKSTDGINFIEIKRVDGAGNSTHTLFYSTRDEYPSAGTNYYRLKQTDYDGKYSYSKIISAHYLTEEQGIIIFPNPVISPASLKVFIQQNSAFKICMSDFTGKNIIELIPERKSKDDNEFEIDISSLARGIYFLRVISERKTYIAKFVIQ